MTPASILRLLSLPALLLWPCFGGAISRADDEPVDSAAALTVEATATLKRVSYQGFHDIEVNVSVTNPRPEPVTVSANLLVAYRGGWLVPLEPETLDGSWFREEGRLDADHPTVSVGPMPYGSLGPVTHGVLMLATQDGHREVAFPIPREGYESPPPMRVPYRFGVGVAGPLQVVPFSDGRRSILLIGQHQCFTGEVPEEIETSVGISQGQDALEEVKWKGLAPNGDRPALWPFFRRIDVPAEFTHGFLLVSAEAKIGGEEVSASQSWPFEAVQPVPVRSPVLDAWQLGNGPGETTLHAHYLSPEHRYAYDFVKVERGSTYSGPVHENESYFAWNKSIHAAADGVIVDVCDREVDGYGNQASGSPCLDNRVVIRHEGGFYTAYLHIRHRSATRNLNSRVRAGDVIARVGNTGLSSEPHLHFMAFRIDATGRFQPVPVAFTNAWHDARRSQRVEDAPVGGRTYYFTDR